MLTTRPILLNSIAIIKMFSLRKAINYLSLGEETGGKMRDENNNTATKQSIVSITYQHLPPVKFFAPFIQIHTWYFL